MKPSASGANVYVPLKPCFTTTLVNEAMPVPEAVVGRPDARRACDLHVPAAEPEEGLDERTPGRELALDDGSSFCVDARLVEDVLRWASAHR